MAICRCEARWQARCGLSGRDLCLPGTPPSACTPTLFHRNLILKMVTLGILCYHWLGRRVGTLVPGVRRTSDYWWGPGGSRPLTVASPHLTFPGSVRKRPGGAGWQGGWGLRLLCFSAGRTVGQELYRLMVMDFIFMLLDTLLGELVWR